MAQSYNPVVSFIANENLALGLRVKLLSTGKVAIAGAAETSIGTVVAPALAGESVAIRTKHGTCTAIVNGGTTAVIIGDVLEAAAAGALVKKNTGAAVAVANKATAADGAAIEVIEL